MLHYAPQHVSSSSCSTSGGPIASPQPLVSSLSVNGHTVCRWRADSVRSPPAYFTAAYRGWRYQRLWWYNWSSWGWAAAVRNMLRSVV